MEHKLYQGGDRLELSRVKNRLKDTNGKPIGVANDKPIVDLRMYEVEYHYGYVGAMAANVIDDNLFAEVDQNGNIFVLIEYIINIRTDGTQTLQKDVLVITKSATKL